jgi:hypothetical protein
MTETGFRAIDFDLLVSSETPPDVWLAEMERSHNLRNALVMLDQCRQMAEARCGQPTDAVLYQQMAFRDLVRSANVAEALHRGHFTIPRLVAARSIQKGIVDSIGGASSADWKAAERADGTDQGC